MADARIPPSGRPDGDRRTGGCPFPLRQVSNAEEDTDTPQSSHHRGALRSNRLQPVTTDALPSASALCFCANFNTGANGAQTGGLARMTAYTARDRILEKLGFASYRDYLASDLWKQIRGQALARDGGKCSMCENRATEVHHTQYRVSVLKGRDLKPLVSLCHRCHFEIEFRSNRGKKARRACSQLGRAKLTLDQANHKLKHWRDRSVPCRVCGKRDAWGLCQRCRMIEKHTVCDMCKKEPPIRRFRNAPRKLCYACGCHERGVTPKDNGRFAGKRVWRGASIWDVASDRQGSP